MYLSHLWTIIRHDTITDKGENIMSQKITFYPLGNAESCLLELANKKTMLFDYANTYTGDEGDLRIDLAEELQKYEEFDVVLLTHAHEDHVQGAKEFFHLDYAKSYQGDNRVKINELWISSAFILDTELSSEDARVIRQEARHRLKNKYGIKVFSEPNKLDGWLKQQGMSTEEVAPFIVHAGQLIINHDLGDEIQFFVHAPFSCDSEDVDDKNDPSIVMQVRLFNDSLETNILITGDTPHEVLEKIVDMSKLHDNQEYLKWDIYDIPHHCSYTGLAEEKGTYMTTPTAQVKWLLSQGESSGKMIASCKVISEHADDSQPPHIEAMRAYKTYGGSDKDFWATMEYPAKDKPKPLVYEIDRLGIREIRTSSGTTHLKSAAPRAGM